MERHTIYAKNQYDVIKKLTRLACEIKADIEYSVRPFVNDAEKPIIMQFTFIKDEYYPYQIIFELVDLTKVIIVANYNQLMNKLEDEIARHFSRSIYEQYCDTDIASTKNLHDTLIEFDPGKYLIQAGRRNGKTLMATQYLNAMYGISSMTKNIQKVIFNDPATIVFWADGTKTVVKCMEGETFDPEKGLAIAICKRVYGDDNTFKKIFKKWWPKKEDDSEKYKVVGKVIGIDLCNDGISVTGKITDMEVLEKLTENLKQGSIDMIIARDTE